MNKLTNEEIEKYVLDYDKVTGVGAITREYLETIDLDEVPEIVEMRQFKNIVNSKGTEYHHGGYTPRVGTGYTPSFGGQQILMGRIGRDLYFTNGRWFWA